MKALSLPKWTRLALLIAYLCFIFLGATAYAQDLIGKGEWQSSSGNAMRGTWTATLIRSGGDMGGTITLKGSPLFAGGDVTGSIENDEVVLGVLAEGDHRAAFKGTLTDGKVSGEWDLPAISDHGTWSGTLQSED